MPKNASQNGDGFRFYSWPGGDNEVLRKYNATEKTDVLSVTSIRSLAGEPYQLVRWKIGNVLNAAMGTKQITRIGPRGGVNKVMVKDGPFPGEFVTRMMESRGNEDKLDDVRRWTRSQADDPRDVAAVRGSVVHKMIELNTSLARISDEGIRERFTEQWQKERRKVKPEVTQEDVDFVSNAMRQYWDMRANVKFVILAQEVQIWNLEAGYAGTLDALIWFLPEDATEADETRYQGMADDGKVTVDVIAKVGGTVTLADWKTSPTVYTGHIVQSTAYLGGQFVGTDGVIDERLSEILIATKNGAVIKVRPNKWEVQFFEWREDIFLAFLGSCVFARFLAMYKTTDNLITRTTEGVAPGTDDSTTESEEDAA